MRNYSSPGIAIYLSQFCSSADFVLPGVTFLRFRPELKSYLEACALYPVASLLGRCFVCLGRTCPPRADEQTSPGKQVQDPVEEGCPSTTRTHAPHPLTWTAWMERSHGKGPSLLLRMVLLWSWQSTEPIAKRQADPGPLVDTGLWQTQAHRSHRTSSRHRPLAVIRPSVQANTDSRGKTRGPPS